jgi:hypothetical protein
MGVGAVISPRITDCGLRRVVKGSNGDLGGDLSSDWARSFDRLRRRLDFGRDGESKTID